MSGKRVVVFDMDGVLYRGGEVLPGVPETLGVLRERRFLLRFLTNNSTRTREHYRGRLASMGIAASAGEIVSSASAAAWYVKKHAPGAPVYVIGEQGLRDELAPVCRVLAENEFRSARFVIAGLDREFTYAKLARAATAIFNGAAFIATNRDPNFPERDGAVIPGGGAIVAAIETASETSPIVIGKPEPLTLELLLETADASPDEILLVGDRPSTDVAAGRRAGIETCLVLTGVASRDDLAKLTPENTPHHVVEDIRGVVEILGLNNK
ncbi:MAG: HAD-IIA family hydrolase [bacterium]